MTDRNGGFRSATGAYPFRYAEQYTPPEPTRLTDVAVTTFEHVFEVDPRLMRAWVLQQQFPNWDSLRIMTSRHEHLEWMHRHFADTVVSGQSLLDEVEAEDLAAAASTVPAQTESDAESTAAMIWTRPETD